MTITQKNTRYSPFYVGRALLFLVVFLAFGLMQYHYWYGENGHRAVKALTEELSNQTSAYHSQIAYNAKLIADVHDLKTGLVATEEYARRDLGLIKNGEIFVQLSTAPLAYDDTDEAFEPAVVEMVDPTISDIIDD